MTKFDIVVFGASGFTGKKVAEELALGSTTKYVGITWAVAGRSKSKLLSVLTEISSKTAVDLSRIKVITADVGDYDSLKAMCEEARVLLNCCGPYRLYGEPVVRAAIEAKTHYLDISGEEDFIGAMQMKYDDAAREAGVYVISACGFESIPNDLGVVFLDKNFGGTLNSVESYLSVSVAAEYQKEAEKCGILNFGTWASAVYLFTHLFELFKMRRMLYPKPLPVLRPELKQRQSIHKQNEKWAVPHISPDRSIVHHTQRHIFETTNKRPVQFQPYIAFPSLSNVLLLGVMSVSIGFLSLLKYGRNLLLTKPEWFSYGLMTKQGPTQAVMDNTHFTVEMIGRGWEAGQDVKTSVPRKTVVAKVSAANPAYGFTSLALVQSALAIIKEKNKMPSIGGVLSTGAAFWDTSLLARLQENNIKFEIVQS